jgi:hypothetical protein
MWKVQTVQKNHKKAIHKKVQKKAKKANHKK